MNKKYLLPTVFFGVMTLASNGLYGQSTFNLPITSQQDSKNISIEQNSKENYSKTTLKYPLISTPDLETSLNEQNAAKARKLANYVIVNSIPKTIDIKDVISTDSNTEPIDYQFVTNIIDIDSMKYTISVVNNDESIDSKKIDRMYLVMIPVGKPALNNSITLMDDGLDGNCDSGVISANLSETGKKSYYHAKTPEFESENIENRERFQILYINALDVLIDYYSTK